MGPSIPRELLAGSVATFALIPEAIVFSFVAGVDPSVGLFASFVISLVIAFTGGRPAMVSAAASSVALVAAPRVQSHGLGYLLAAGLLAGAVQVAFGLMKLGVLMRFVSSSVRTGFVNAPAIVIFAPPTGPLGGRGACHLGQAGARARADLGPAVATPVAGVARTHGYCAAADLRGDSARWHRLWGCICPQWATRSVARFLAVFALPAVPVSLDLCRRRLCSGYDPLRCRPFREAVGQELLANCCR